MRDSSDISVATAALWVAIESGIGAECAPKFLREGADPFCSAPGQHSALSLALALGEDECIRAIFGSRMLDHRISETELFAEKARAAGRQDLATWIEAQTIRAGLAEPSRASPPTPRL
jgi:hypothetical protein